MSAIAVGTSRGTVVIFDTKGEILQRTNVSSYSIDEISVGPLLTIIGASNGEIKSWKSPVLSQVRGGWVPLFVETSGSVNMDGGVTSLSTGGVEGVAATTAGSVF